MAGGLLPPGMWDLHPLWRNLFENDGTVQFIHRMNGYLVLIAGLVTCLLARRSPHPDHPARPLPAARRWLLVQMVLGVATVMHSSPLGIAIFHQGGAILLFLLVLRARFLARYPVERSLRG